MLQPRTVHLRKVRELQESDKRYELAVTLIEAGLWDWNILSNVLFISDHLKELLGYAPDEIVLTIDKFWDRVHPDDYQLVRLAVEEHLEERVPFNMDYRLQTKSGEYRWFHDRGQALWDNAGKAIRMSGSLTDITSRKQTELELNDSCKKLTTAEHVAGAGFLDWDLNTNEIVWSHGVYNIMGIDPETPVTVDQTMGMIHPDDSEFVKKNIDMFIQGISNYNIDHRMVRPDGRVVWVQACADLERDTEGIPSSLMATVVDITDRKSVENELIQSEEHFRSLIEQSPLAIELLAPDGTITQVNKAWMQLWGTSEAETAQVLEKYNMLTDKQTEDLGVGPLIKKAFEDGESVVLPIIEYSSNRTGHDIGLRHIHGKSPWIQCHLSPVLNEDGEILFVVNTYMDVTDRKNLEEETCKQQDILARMDRASRMGQLSGSIAHELSQPLTGILSNAQAAELMMRDGQSDSDELAEILSDIVADTKRSAKIIHGLRELYREQKSDTHPVDINNVVRDTEQLLHSEFILQNISVTSELALTLPPVSGNVVQIQQVLVNIIMNGIQAMKIPAINHRRLHIVTVFEFNEVKLWIEDTGHGFDAGIIDQLFEPLATWNSGGTGMGLAISNSIIKVHGGRMWAENRPERGARVGFALPVVKKGQ